jgi:hypothetical protein
MKERQKGGEKGRLPAQQAQQPQPVQIVSDEALGARAGSLTGLLEKKKNRKPDSLGREGEPKLDQARFTAGIVRFYEALLKEPIPEKMLRLIEEIAMREQKS